MVHVGMTVANILKKIKTLVRGHVNFGYIKRLRFFNLKV